MYFLLNASTPEHLDAATYKTLQVDKSPDIEGTEQHFV